MAIKQSPKTAVKPAPVDTSVSESDPRVQLAKFLTSNKADHFNLEERPTWYTLSSGSLNLDAEGVMFAPGVYRCCGGPNLGKTPFLLNVADTLLDVVPNSRVVWCFSEGRLSDQNLARLRHKVVYSADEWAVGTIFVFKTNTFETWINLKRSLVANNPTGCRYGFFTDSIDNMILKDDMVKEFSESSKVAGTPAMTKRLFQKMGLAMRERGHWSFFVSQRTSAIKIDPYSKAEPRQSDGGGGNSLSHNADEVLEFQEWYEGDLILEKPDEKPDRIKNKAVGHNIRIKLRKSSNEKRFTVIEIPIKHGISKGSAIWREREIADQLMVWGLVTKKGSWLTLTDTLQKELAEKAGVTDVPTQVQGVNQLYVYLESNPVVTDYLFARFKTMISGVSSTAKVVEEVALEAVST